MLFQTCLPFQALALIPPQNVSSLNLALPPEIIPHLETENSSDSSSAC